MNTRPNYILLLELDPDDSASDDWAQIEARLVEKTRKWNRQRSQGTPRQQREAARIIAQLTDLRAVLSDPESRAEERRAARRERQARRAEDEKALIERLAVRKASGSLTRNHLERLVKEFDGRIDRGRIEALARAEGLSVIEPGAKAPSKRRPTLDLATGRAIDSLCDALGVASLYDFLGLRENASPKALYDRATEIYQEIIRIGMTGPEETTRSTLAGRCKAIFEDAATKARYDTWFAHRALHTLHGSIDAAGQDGFINARALDVLLHQARDRGVGADDARRYIEQYAADKGWGVEPRGRTAPVALPRCGFCGTVGRSAKDRRCPGCGELFEQPCPLCGTANPTERPTCRDCGCTIGDAGRVKSLMRQAHEAHQAHRLPDAIRYVEQALVHWPGWVEATAKRDEYVTLRDRAERQLSTIDALIADRRFVKARGAIDRLHRLGSSAPARQEVISDALSRAQRVHRQGEELERRGDLEGAVEHYGRALAACTDYEDARAAIERIPPPPPASLTVASFGSGLRIGWTPPSVRGTVEYRVVRKAGGRPTSASDGERLGDVTARQYDDLDARPGTAWYYAVYTVRGGVPSTESAWSGPHLELAEVTHLEAVPGDTQVVLSWSRPTGCLAVEVHRAVNTPPTKAGMGRAVRVTGDSAVDARLTNGRIYGYRVNTVFADPSRPGQRLRSRGVSVAIAPEAPPPSITDLTGSRQDKVVYLRWTPPPEPATSHVRFASRQPDVASGRVVATTELARIGVPLPNVGPGRAQHTLTAQGRAYFVPVSSRGDVSVLGTPYTVVALDGVTHLSSQVSGSSLHLTWQWPTGVDEVLVRWSHDRYPSSAEGGAALSERVTRAAYGRQGTWMIANAPRKPHFIAVFARSPDGYYADPSHHLESMGASTTLRYRVRLKRGGLRRRIKAAWIEIEGDAASDELIPTIVVVGHQGRTPIGLDDGEELMRTRDLRLTDRHAVIELPPEIYTRNLYVKLFFGDAGDAQLYRLLPEAADQLRIG